MKTVCMIVQEPLVKGGISAVVNGYRGSKLEKDFSVIYVESYQDGSKLFKLLKAIKSYFVFGKVLIVDKPDLVHIHSSFGASFYRKIPFIYISAWLKKPVINHIHGADFENFYLKASDLKKSLINKVYGKCTLLIALSTEWKERLSLIVPAQKIQVIENYSILNEDALLQRSERECNNIVLFLGELGYRKGCFDIPAVIEQVIQKIPKAKFILGGSGTQQEEAAIKRLIKKNVENHVMFPGWVRGNEKDKLLREADVFFLPSYNEGMPMSILDAMGYGLPIVTTNVGGIPKIVHNGENGYCCNPGDIQSLSNGISDLLGDKDLRKRSGINSFNIVKNQYSLEAHIDLLEKVYENTKL